MSTWNFDKAIVISVTDGDTVKLEVDQGFDNSKKGSFRIFGNNARELKEPGGQEARANLLSLIPVGTQLHLESVKNDKYSRYDAILFLGDLNIGQHLIDTGWAVAWSGAGPKPSPVWPRISQN